MCKITPGIIKKNKENLFRNTAKFELLAFPNPTNQYGGLVGVICWEKTEYVKKMRSLEY